MSVQSKPEPSALDQYFALSALEKGRVLKGATASREEAPSTELTGWGARRHQAATIAFGTISAVAWTATVTYAALTLYEKPGTENERNMFISAAALLTNAVVSSIYGSVKNQAFKFTAIAAVGPINLIWGACALAGYCKDA